MLLRLLLVSRFSIGKYFQIWFDPVCSLCHGLSASHAACRAHPLGLLAAPLTNIPVFVSFIWATRRMLLSGTVDDLTSGEGECNSERPKKRTVCKIANRVQVESNRYFLADQSQLHESRARGSVVTHNLVAFFGTRHRYQGAFT